ncbi:hypothetical protein EAG18_20485 [Pseudoalteromonas sp. J010]|nr:hypothetical protein EAG18_20485 [Pseudoalteromonas sp. J010]
MTIYLRVPHIIENHRETSCIFNFSGVRYLKSVSNVVQCGENAHEFSFKKSLVLSTIIAKTSSKVDIEIYYKASTLWSALSEK